MHHGSKDTIHVWMMHTIQYWLFHINTFLLVNIFFSMHDYEDTSNNYMQKNTTIMPEHWTIPLSFSTCKLIIVNTFLNVIYTSCSKMKIHIRSLRWWIKYSFYILHSTYYSIFFFNCESEIMWNCIIVQQKILVIKLVMVAKRVVDRTIAQQWCHNKFALCNMWICTILSHTKIILWVKYAIMHYALTCAGYVAGRKIKIEIWLIQGTRVLSILFNLVNIWGFVQHKWRMY